MNDILRPPTERDLPAGRAERIRAGVLAALAEPEPAHTGRRVAVLAAVVTTVAAGAGGAALWPSGNGGGSTQALAMSATELPASLRGAADQCLEWSRDQHARPPGEPGDPVVTVGLDDLAVATRHGHRAALLFMTDAGYFACDLVTKPGREITGGTNSDEWRDRANWLPGPVQRLGLSSSELDGGDVMVTGRVSDRVRRLVLEHGDGRTTAARLEDGAFGVVSRGGPVRASARLVSYDADGNELGRMPLFDKSYLDRCYADPAGKVLYLPRTATKGAPPPDPATCLPTERWGY
jgi:hypothetical protein